MSSRDMEQKEESDEDEESAGDIGKKKRYEVKSMQYFGEAPYEYWEA